MVVTPDIDEALRRMDPYDLDMRNKRLKRAADLSVKHTYLPYELQEKHDPWADSSTFHTCVCSAKAPSRTLTRPFVVAFAFFCPQSRRC
jgi:hypothetical protein